MNVMRGVSSVTLAPWQTSFSARPNSRRQEETRRAGDQKTETPAIETVEVGLAQMTLE